DRRRLLRKLLQEAGLPAESPPDLAAPDDDGQDWKECIKDAIRKLMTGKPEDHEIARQLMKLIGEDADVEEDEEEDTMQPTKESRQHRTHPGWRPVMESGRPKTAADQARRLLR